MSTMVEDLRMTVQVARVLSVMLANPKAEHYGLSVLREADLSSGSLYPILRRLEQARWLTSSWEAVDAAEAGRPRRRYYQLTGEGVVAARNALAELAQLVRPHGPRRAGAPGLAGGSV